MMWWWWWWCIYSQCSTGDQFPLQVTFCKLSSRERVGGLVSDIKIHPYAFFLRWPTNPFGIVLSATLTIGTTLVLIFYSFLNSLARSWYFSIFSFSFSSTLASPGTATLIIWQAACRLFAGTRSALLHLSYYYYHYCCCCCCFRKPIIIIIIVFENKRGIRVSDGKEK